MKKSMAFIAIVASLVIVSTMLETFAAPVFAAVSQVGNQDNATGSGNSTNLGSTNNGGSNPSTSGSSTSPQSSSGY